MQNDREGGPRQRPEGAVAPRPPAGGAVLPAATPRGITSPPRGVGVYYPNGRAGVPWIKARLADGSYRLYPQWQRDDDGTTRVRQADGSIKTYGLQSPIALLDNLTGVGGSREQTSLERRPEGSITVHYNDGTLNDYPDQEAYRLATKKEALVQRFGGESNSQSPEFRAAFEKEFGKAAWKDDFGGLRVDVVGGRDPTPAEIADMARDDPAAAAWFEEKNAREKARSGVVGGIDATVRGAADAASFGVADRLSAGINTLFNDKSYRENLRNERATNDFDERYHPIARLGGEIAGGTATAGGLETGLSRIGTRLLPKLAPQVARWTPRLADFAYGVGSGYANAEDRHGPSNAIGDGTSSLIGGMFGRNFMRGAGNVLTGVRNDAVQYLHQRGIPLTVGQAVSKSGPLGRVIKAAEDELGSSALIGNLVDARRTEGLAGFNREMFDQTLAPIGTTTNGVMHQSGIDVADAAIGKAQGTALDSVQLRGDGPFVDQMAPVVEQARALPPSIAANAGYTLDKRVAGAFGPDAGLSGDGFRQSIQGLNRDAKAMRGEPYGDDFEDVTKRAQGALEGVLERQAPDAVPAYRQAQEASRNLEVVRDAMKLARHSGEPGDPPLVLPFQLADAAKANAGRLGDTPVPFLDLTDAGTALLPSRIPKADSSGRLAKLLLPATLGGSGVLVGSFADDKQKGAGAGLALGAALALGGTRTGQRVMTRVLLDRPDFMARFGNRIYDRASIGGALGAGVTPLLFPDQ